MAEEMTVPPSSNPLRICTVGELADAVAARFTEDWTRRKLEPLGEDEFFWWVQILHEALEDVRILLETARLLRKRFPLKHLVDAYAPTEDDVRQFLQFYFQFKQTRAVVLAMPIPEDWPQEKCGWHYYSQHTSRLSIVRQFLTDICDQVGRLYCQADSEDGRDVPAVHLLDDENSSWRLDDPRMRSWVTKVAWELAGGQWGSVEDPGAFSEDVTTNLCWKVDDELYELEKKRADSHVITRMATGWTIHFENDQETKVKDNLGTQIVMWLLHHPRTPAHNVFLRDLGKNQGHIDTPTMSDDQVAKLLSLSAPSHLRGEDLPKFNRKGLKTLLRESKAIEARITGCADAGMKSDLEEEKERLEKEIASFVFVNGCMDKARWSVVKAIAAFKKTISKPMPRLRDHLTICLEKEKDEPGFRVYRPSPEISWNFVFLGDTSHVAS